MKKIRSVLMMCLECLREFRGEGIRPACPHCASRAVSTLNNPRFPVTYIHLH